MPDPVKVTFLGGLGEIGRNCAAIEIDERIMLIDCGLMFPDADMPGVDLVLPDFTYLRERADRIEGLIATHGHEDHVGGISYLLRDLKFPIYGSELTVGLARGRIEEAGLVDRTDFRVVRDGERRQIGPFDCEFFPVAHSVPHGFATAFHTPQGTILHSGDFKIDLTPVDGRLTDLAGLGALAIEDGIRLLLADSTNADEAGFSSSETEVGASLEAVFAAQTGRRLVIACFASHVHRVQQIANVAVKQGRTVATLGRSMNKNVGLARQMKLLDIPERSLVDIEDVANLDPGKVCIISTGSQGEPMSALSLMARSENRWLKIGPDDTVVLSSHPIPGNESGVSKVIDGLVRLGARVVHSGVADVHATGHAKREELKLFHSIVQPDYFVPVHGEYRHMTAHARIGELMGTPSDNILVCEDGDQVLLTDKGLVRGQQVEAGYVYVDGIVGDVGTGLLRDRQVLGEEGVVAVVVVVDIGTRTLVAGPEIITRGWVHAAESEDVLDDAAREAHNAVTKALGKGDVGIDNINKALRRSVGKFVNERTQRRPMIVPVVMEA